MVFNKKKFNFLVVLTLVLIAVIVGISAITVLAVEKENVIKVEGEEENNSNQETQEGEETKENNEVENQEDKESNVVGKSEFVALPSQFRTAKQAFNYAFKLLSSKDYSVKIEQSVDAGAMGISGVQKISKNVYFVDGTYYVKSIADGKDVPMNYGENYTEFAMIDATNVAVKREGGDLATQSIQSYKSVYGILPSEIPYDIDSSSLSSLGNSPESNYYEITEILTAKEYASYLKNLEKSGGEGSNPRIASISVTIKIDKVYGYITSITATENYTIQRSGMEADAKSKITMKFSYSGIKESSIEEIKSQFN